MKYIMFEDFGGDPVPVIFPNRVGYEEMREQIPYSKVLSAGYVQMRGKEFYTHGEAKELEAKSRAEDADIIASKLMDPED